MLSFLLFFKALLHVFFLTALECTAYMLLDLKTKKKIEVLPHYFYCFTSYFNDRNHKTKNAKQPYCI